MKSVFAVAGALAVSACAQAPDVISLDDIRDARGELPGFSTVINCSKAPRYIFDKHGEIVDTIHPIRHPSCAEREARAEARRQARANVNEATDDDRPRTIVALDVPVDPEVTVPTETVTPTEPKLPTDVDTCNGALHCEPDSKTEPEAYRIWLEKAKKRYGTRNVISASSRSSWF